ncbi:MAG: formate dehydrogenase accessory sulfurtransferase FdhD [Promethearchaeota archaeon]|nr:MAG: formate dehydrogenase accessory sulfurtransferase FdhD [Candidatus Lokiarchaeota archaeon]
MFKRKVNITRVHDAQVESLDDTVLIESPIDIFVNSEPVVNIVCLPNHLKELAIGFLFSIGIIDSIEDINNIQVNELENQIKIRLANSIKFDINKLNLNAVGRVIDTSCGITSPWRDIIKSTLSEINMSEISNNNLKISSQIIVDSVKTMQKEMNLYRETGGCHGAAIFDTNGEIITVREDIGRHNAIDKVIGALVLKKHDFKDIFLISSGRLTGDSVLKAIRAKIPILASVSAPIESGIRLAFTYGITLIGFVRGKRMNIYTHPKRILI